MQQKGVNPVELMIDMALERDFKMFFRQPLANENQDHVLEMMKHPRSVVTFSDSGAHVGADHGFVTANPPAQLLGTGETSAEFRSRYTPNHIRHRNALGAARSRPGSTGYDCRFIGF